MTTDELREKVVKAIQDNSAETVLGSIVSPDNLADAVLAIPEIALALQRDVDRLKP